MMNNWYAVILAGGKGERFWPLSTAKRPKQLLSLVGDKTLIAQAVDRLDGLIPPERVLVITSHDLVEETRKAAPVLPPANIFGEPMGRDTAAAVALAAAMVKARSEDAVFCILTADHVIGDLEVFRQTLHDSFKVASEQEVLVTIGIAPRGPSTAYGYIQTGTEVPFEGGTVFARAKKFVEKPDLETAQQYLKSGNYLWNSGMFIWSVSSIQKAFQSHQPQLAGLISHLSSMAGSRSFVDEVRNEYAQLEKISIDYAVMEKASNIVTARGTFAWDDVGSWPALEGHLPPDTAGNTINGLVRAVNASSNIVVSGGNHLTALIGVKNLVVVQAPGVTLVCSREAAQDVKKMVQSLKDEGNFSGLL